MITIDGGIETESKIDTAGKMLGGMKKVFCCRMMGMDVKRKLHERIAVLTTLYGMETCSTAVAEKKKLDVMKMRCLRS